MKTIRILLAVLALALLTGSGQAATDSHRAAIERLFKVLKIDKQYEVSMLAGFDAGTGLTADRMAALPQDQREKLQQTLAKVKARMVELMGWDKVKPEMVELYAKHFTEKEIDAIAKMMESPTGQMLVSKQLTLMPDAMGIGQKKAQAAMPEIMKIMQEDMK